LTALSSGKNELFALSYDGKSHWLINTGRGLPSGQAKWVLEPYLKARGINQVKAVILTDDYRKHTGGLQLLTDNFSLQSLYYPKHSRKFLEDARLRSALKHVNTQGVTSGDRVNNGGLEHFRVLDVTRRGLMLVIRYKEAKILFLPALNDEVLRTLEKYRSEIIDIDLLLLASQRDVAKKFIDLLFDWTDPDAVSRLRESITKETFRRTRYSPFES